MVNGEQCTVLILNSQFSMLNYYSRFFPLFSLFHNIRFSPFLPVYTELNYPNECSFTGGENRNGADQMFRIMVIALLPLFLTLPAHADWDFSKHSIPVEDIRGGGPPRDGIPALFNPGYLTGREADKLLKPDERVLGLTLNGVSRAYPIRIMSWHELVNDKIDGIPYLVSW